MRRLVLLTALLVACRGEHAAPDAAPPDPYASFRERARVPTIAYASFTKDAVVASGATPSAAGGTTADTVLGAASIAKPIVAATVLELHLELDAPVTRWLPFPIRPVTLRMLLAHTACVRDDVERIRPPPTRPLGELLKAYVADAPWIEPCTPGTTFAYSNVGYALAAYVVERAKGLSFDEQSKRLVFEPLGMTHTAWGRDHWVYPASDLRSTANDLARFGQELARGGTKLAPANVDVMLAGLGLQHRRIGGRDVVGHEGEDVTVSSGLFVDVLAGRGAVILANGDAFSANDPARAQALEDMLAELIRSPR